MGKHTYTGQSELIVPDTANGTVVVVAGDVVEVLDAEADLALNGREDFTSAPDDAVATTNTRTIADKEEAGAPVEAAPAPVVPIAVETTTGVPSTLPEFNSTLVTSDPVPEVVDTSTGVHPEPEPPVA